MKTEEIRTNGQVRKDLGDLTELKQSIATHGILQPLVVDQTGLLIAGHRRLAVAKELKIKDVPTQTLNVKDSKVIPVLQLIENIQRKNLDPIEEGRAYQEYIEKNNSTVEELATSIGKTKEYVERRVKLKNLTPKAEEALKNKKIEIGHALLLNQMKATKQKDALEFIIDYDLTVQNFADQIRWMPKMDFLDIEFRGEVTKQRTLLDGICAEMLPKNEVANGTLIDNKNFKADMLKYIESQREVLRKKGITVFSSVEGLKEKYPQARELNEWNSRYTTIVKGLPKSKKHAVVIDLSRYGSLSREVWDLKPKQESSKKAETVKEMSEEERAEADKILERTRKEKLIMKLSEYELKHLRKGNQELLQKETKIVKALQVAYNTGHYGYNIDELMSKTPGALDKMLFDHMQKHISTLGTDDLEKVAKSTGFDWAKHWVIDEEFLELHTKDQLIALIKELKLGQGDETIEWNSLSKKADYVDFILSYELKGQVPKILGAR